MLEYRVVVTALLDPAEPDKVKVLLDGCFAAAEAVGGTVKVDAVRPRATKEKKAKP